MRHVPMSLIMRAGGENIILGETAEFERVRSEFLEQYATSSDPRRSDSLEMFRWVEARIQPGDEVRKFTVDSPRPHAPVFATKGYAILREGGIIDGVILDTEPNPDYGAIFAAFDNEFTDEEMKQEARGNFVELTDAWRTL